MRFILAVGLAALPIAAVAADSPVRPPAPATDAKSDTAECKTMIPRLVREPVRAVPRRLGELPPGDLHLAVQREVDGCLQDTIVRTGYGAGR